MKKTYRFLLIPFLVSTLSLIALCLLGELFPYPYRYVFAGVLLILLIAAYVLVYRLLQRQRQNQLILMDSVFSDNKDTSARVVQQIQIPSMLINETGNIIWRNDAMEALFSKSNIRFLIPSFDPVTPPSAMPLSYNGNNYVLHNMMLERENIDRPILFQYWIDRTEATHYKRLFEDQMPYVALIYADNYQELSADVQFHRTTVMAQIERLVSEATRNIGGIYRRYESGRFFIIFEAGRLAQLEEEKFPLLEEAKKIDTGTNIQVSLSIAIGAADRILASDESARQAMELALGRGGDQAVIKQGTAYRFYGGKKQLDSMQSQVRARLFSTALRQLFENSGDVFIMGHQRSDLDCIGSALGIAVCAKKAGVRPFIIRDENGAGIDQAISLIESSPFASCLVTPEQAEKLIRPSSVLIVVDTQRPSIVLEPRFLTLFDRIVVIDHHRRNADYIENPTLHYLESRASSASELVTEILQYFDDDILPPALVCGVLLAGITMDTKHFAINVSARTFEAAAYLRKNGADITTVKQLFQEDMDSFRNCSDTVRSMQLLPNGIAIACVPPGVEKSRLIAAKAADDLIGIRGIEAAFVLGEDDTGVSLSGRSLGGINVQVLCEQLGGGGHLTIAGAQFPSLTLEEAREKVLEVASAYQPAEP